MAYLMFRFFRAVDRLWDSVSVLRKLRDSKPFQFIMNVVMFFVFVGIFISLPPSTFPQILAPLISLVWVLLYALLIGSAFWVAGCSFSHPGSSSDNLAKCARLLEDQGFTVRKLTQNSIHAKRGSFFQLHIAEQEWKEFPMRVMVTATDSGPSSTLDVLCVCLIGVRLWFVQNSRAIAELDGLGLARLSRTIPARQRGLSLSGLGNKIFRALAIISTISVVVTLVLTAIVQRNYIENAIGMVGQEFLFERREHVLDALELPVSHEIDRQLTARATDSGLPAAERLGGLEPGTAEGRLIIALEQPDGAITHVLPRPDTALEPLARAMFLTGINDLSKLTEKAFVEQARVEQAGDRIFVQFSRRYHRELASRLGLKGGQLAVGLLLSYPELASLAPRNREWSGTELTYYRHGNPILHYDWSGVSVVVNQGAGTLPREVISAAMDAETFDLLSPYRSAYNTIRGGAQGRNRSVAADAQPHRRGSAQARIHQGPDGQVPVQAGRVPDHGWNKMGRCDSSAA